MLVQILIPAAAMAHDIRESGSSIIICTADGPKVLTIGEDGVAWTEPAKDFAGFKCSQCVAPSLAADVPAPAPLITTVRYAVRIEPTVVRVLGVRGHARAPPRPPGQGPPSFLNA